MAKQGQHQKDAVDHSHPRGHEHSRFNNNPSKTVDITTGSVKKHDDPPQSGERKNEGSNRGPEFQTSEFDSDDAIDAKAT